MGESHAAMDCVHGLSEMRRADKEVGEGQMLGMRSWEGRVPTTAHQGNSSWYGKWEKQQGKIIWKHMLEKQEENDE